MTGYLPTTKRWLKWAVVLAWAAGLGGHCGNITLSLDPAADEPDANEREAYCSGASGITYYVRSGGGTSTQCTGTVDAPYPGEGEGQPCAFSHPSDAFPPDGASVLASGDRLVIGRGEYSINVLGFDEEGIEACPWASEKGCAIGAVPSGIDDAHPTCVVGEGWNEGCEDPPTLTGAEHTPWLLNLQDAGFVTVGCLELTDKASCVTNHTDETASCDVLAEGMTDEVALDGIFATGSSHVTLTNLDIHGLARFGIFGQEVADWTLDNIEVTANGNGGIVVLAGTTQTESESGCDALVEAVFEVAARCWVESEVPEEACPMLEELIAMAIGEENNYVSLIEVAAICIDFDLSDDACLTVEEEYANCMAATEEVEQPASSSGEMRLTEVFAAMNGCGEQDGEIVNCYSGDNSSGLLVADSAADWTISSSTFAHNTRDGVRIALVDSALSVSMDRTRLEGNAGFQLTVSGNTTLVNTIVAGNCDYFLDSPFDTSVTSCRDRGVAMAFELLSDQEVVAINDTVFGRGESLMSVYAMDEGEEITDHTAPLVLVVNTIFSGDEGPYGLPFLVMPEALDQNFQWYKNIFFQMNEVEGLGLCDTGSFIDNLCVDPLFVSTDPAFGHEMDLSLEPVSPAIDSGLSKNTSSLVPDVDFWNNPRPSGEGVDVGAVELQLE